MDKHKVISAIILIGCIGLTFAGCMSGTNNKLDGNEENMGTQNESLENIKIGGFVAAASVHDPSIEIGEDGKYYIFGSHMSAAISEDLKEWKTIASGVDSKNTLFNNLFEPDFEAFKYVGKNTEDGYSVWAPDIIYNEVIQKYVMYFCTTSSAVKSNLCMAVSDSLQGPYTYKDTILYSGFTEETIKQTNFYEVMPQDTDLSRYLASAKSYNNYSWPNCIDPCLFTDQEGRMWMAYGSWSGGIFILEINKETGYPIHPEADEENGVDTYFGKKLIGGLHNPIEGAFILYDAETTYYYLFVSYGELTANGGYQIRLFRSIKPDGPYEDVTGNTLGNNSGYNKYGVKMMGNYTFPSLNYTYMAPGHCSAFIDQDGKMYVAYHQRFAERGEYHEPRVHQLFRTQNSWLATAPFATNGETLRERGYKPEEISGTYYMVNHETDVTNVVHQAEKIVLKQDGTIDGIVQGDYILDEENAYITIKLKDRQYEGIVIEMNDEAGNPTICFSAVGDNNETILGVQYR